MLLHLIIIGALSRDVYCPSLFSTYHKVLLDIISLFLNYRFIILFRVILTPSRMKHLINLANPSQGLSNMVSGLFYNSRSFTLFMISFLPKAENILTRTSSFANPQRAPVFYLIHPFTPLESYFLGSSTPVTTPCTLSVKHEPLNLEPDGC